jgi:hypothetical protein
MVYPALPAAASFPAFLNPFDESFMHGASDAMISIAAAAQIPPISYGGAVINVGGWDGGIANNSPCPMNAIFGWSYIRIVPPGFSGTSPARYWQGRVGPRYSFWSADPGGVPFLT